AGAANVSGLDGRRAPWPGVRRSRRAFVLSGPVAPHPADGRRLVGIALLAEPVWRGIGSDPQPDFDRPVAQLAPALGIDVPGVRAHQLQRADDAGDAGELGEAAQR